MELWPVEIIALFPIVMIDLEKGKKEVGKKSCWRLFCVCPLFFPSFATTLSFGDKGSQFWFFFLVELCTQEKIPIITNLRGGGNNGS